MAPAELDRSDAEQTTMPAPPPAPGDLLLGRGARFEGKLTFQGTVRIDAEFIGSIVTNDVLVVGEGARLKADISCGTVVVHGEIEGDITATTAVELYRPAKVRGNVTTPSLSVEAGVLFQGSSRMGQPVEAKRSRSASRPSPEVETPGAPSPADGVP